MQRSPRPSPSGATRRFPLLQALRGAAALAIALLHIADEAYGTPPPFPFSGVLPLGAGVDLFFVISGFVIVHSSEHLFGGGAVAARRFAKKRLVRILPLYWGATAAFLLAAAMLPAAINEPIGNAWNILASFLFIPAPRPDGAIQPVLSLGWTLNYEMFFYALFALGVGLPRRVTLLGLPALMLVLVLAGNIGDFTTPVLRFWCDQMVLEFAAGMLLAGFLRERIRLGVLPRLLLAVLAVLLLHRDLGEDGSTRLLGFGIPAVLLVAAATLGRQRQPHSRVARAVIGAGDALGNASYALYLLHPFAMRATALILRSLLPNSIYLSFLVLIVGILLSLLLAFAAHRGFELPVQRRLGSRSLSVTET